MKVYAISDLHLDHNGQKPMDIFDAIWSGQEEEIKQSYKELGIKKDDVLVVAGDISWAMRLEDAKNDLKFFDDFDCKIIILRGNHDYWWGSISSVRDSLPKNIFALQNDAIKIGDKIFCGTRLWLVPDGRQKKEDKKIYDREIIRLNMSIQAAKKLQTNNEEIILITHYPPFCKNKKDNEALKMISEAGIKTVIYGHLHGKYHGYSGVTEIGGIKYFLTSCDFVKNQIVAIIG